MSREYEAVVIGGGPGGYIAAIELGQLGVKAALVERAKMGGVCLNWGCIPSKALLHVAHTVHHLSEAEQFGVSAKEVDIDIDKTRQWKDGIVQQLSDGVRRLVKANGCEIIEGNARFKTSRSLEVTGADGQTEEIVFKKCIIATGAKPMKIPGFEVDNECVWGAQKALDIPIIPKRLAVIGGGVIGLELGTAYAKLGSSVTIIEMMEGLLPGVDRDLVRMVERKLKGLGVKVFTGAKASRLEKLEKLEAEKSLKISVESARKNEDIECDRILVATGFVPNSKNLNLDGVGINTDERSAVSIDENLQTSVEGIYAIGDVTGPPYLAHRASKMGEIAAGNIAGERRVYDYTSIPSAIFTDPEIALTGISEEAAKVSELDYSVGKFMFAANGRALGANEGIGFAKTIVDNKSKKIIGAGIVGLSASELISELTLGIALGITPDTIGDIIHPHPTLSEAVQEAALAALGRAKHAVNRPQRTKSTPTKSR